MKSLMEQIDAHLTGDTLVFPSEIAAEFWRRAAVGGTGRIAVREDRLISWDTFKEKAFELRQEAMPSNRTVRTVFAERFIRENADRPVLRELIAPAFAADAAAFTGAVESVLTRIPAALTVLRGQSDGRLWRLRRDLEHLQVRYSDFMDQHGLFEPRWLQASRHFRGGAYRLVVPELADDYAEFQAALAGLPRVPPRVPAAPEGDPTLLIFDDSRTEMKWVLRSIARLLDGGTDPDEIFLTVGDLDPVSDRLRHEAEKYSIPLTIRAGRVLSDSAVGRFLRDMGEVVASGFGVGPLERLILNQGIPWRDMQLNAATVVSGVEHGAIGGTTGPDPRWRRVGRGDRQAQGKLVAMLHRLIPRVVGAETFSQLRSSFNEFLSTAVVRADWTPSDERVLERTQEQLRDLVAVEQDTGLIVDNPYRFWLDRLSEHQYVPQRTRSGITVLPYRVGAAACPRHHFVMNATHSATAVVVRPFPFLSDADREELDTEIPDRDLSSLFLDVYSQSGENVTFSVARHTFDGSALPAGYFVSGGRTDVLNPNDLTRLRDEDTYAAEEFLESGQSVAARTDAEYLPTALQVLGSAAYLTGARGAGPDYTREPIVDPAVREIAQRRLLSRSHPGLLRLSASHIDSFRSCPFAYMLSRGLGLEDLALEGNPDDASELGLLYHRILADFFDDLARSGESFRAENLPELKRRLSEIADTAYHERSGMIPDIVYGAHREVFGRVADALMENDAVLIDGHAAQLVEAWTQEQESEDGYVLVGRLDRATRAPDGSLTLVDYKKSTLPTRKSINAGSEAELGDAADSRLDRVEQLQLLGSVQIPLYIRLLESSGQTVGAAGFYSLEKATYLAVVGEDPGDGKACMSRERLGEVMDLVDHVVSDMVSRISSGEFGCSVDCGGCPLRSVCRTRFHVR